MKLPQRLFLTFAVFHTAVSSLLGVELRPQFETRVFDGEVIRKPYFTDGDKRYGVILDGETEIGETSTGAIFRFRTIPLASMTLSPSPFRTSQAFNSANEPIYRAAAQRLLPSTAQDVVLTKIVPEPLPVNGWRSYRYEFSYKSLNGIMCEAITFLNLAADQQIVMRTVGRQTAWAEVTSRADNIISRWYEIRQEQELNS